jgi:hypothetical protein
MTISAPSLLGMTTSVDLAVLAAGAGIIPIRGRFDGGGSIDSDSEHKNISVGPC